MITRRGIGFVIIGVSVFFVASATRVGWLHVADALLWGVILLSAVLPWISVPWLRASRSVDVPNRRRGEIGPVVGDSIKVRLELRNPTRWPRFFISARQPSSTGGESSTSQRFFFAALGPRGTAGATGDVQCDRRGWRDFDDAVIESRIPFGLFRRRRRVAAPGRVLVYPRWHHLERLGLMGASLGDEAARRRARRGDEIAGSRPYVVGDSVRDIHWKNSARTGRAAVKQYDAGAEESLVIGFDAAIVYGTGAETTLEYAASLAASVSRAITRRGGAVGLAINGQISRSTPEWGEIMQLLAVAGTDPRHSLSAGMHNVAPGERVFAIVSGRDRASISALEALSGRGASIGAVVLDGFAAGDDAAPAIRSLEAAGVRAVACHRGAIEGAIQLIETGTSARITAPRARVEPLGIPVETAGMPEKLAA